MNRQNKMIFLSVSAVALAGIGVFFALTGDAKDITDMGEQTLPEASSQEANSLSENGPTIKVTGNAVTMLEPDQATMRITMRSQPMDIADALAHQDQETENLIGAIIGATGEDGLTEIEQGWFGLHQYYIGQESYTNIETFTIRSAVSIEMDIEQFSKMVNQLTDEGYTFESVYASPRFQGLVELSSRASSAMDTGNLPAEYAAGGGEEEIEEDAEYSQIILNVAISTRPAPIDEAVNAYEEKHQRLLQILIEEMKIPLEKIQPASVSIDPMYYGPANQNMLYNYHSQIIVNTNPENIAGIIAAIEQYDVFVDEVYITISDKQLDKIEGDLNLAAFNNAKARAEKIAKMTGLVVGGVQSIESIMMPMEQRRAFSGNMYSADSWRYMDTWKIGTAVTVEFELTR